MLDLDELPAASRLALAYAPRSSRVPLAALLALDARLSRIGQHASEPIIAQLKLAWWRDQFGKPADQWPVGEPLLAVLNETGIAGSHLVALVDGWEKVVVSEELVSADVMVLAQGRAAAWMAAADTGEGTAAARSIEIAAREWTMGEFAAFLDPVEGLGSTSDLSKAPRLDAALRPLAVLARLGRRAQARRSALMDGPGAMLLAMRVGFFGR